MSNKSSSNLRDSLRESRLSKMHTNILIAGVNSEIISEEKVYSLLSSYNTASADDDTALLDLNNSVYGVRVALSGIMPNIRANYYPDIDSKDYTEKFAEYADKVIEAGVKAGFTEPSNLVRYYRQAMNNDGASIEFVQKSITNLDRELDIVQEKLTNYVADIEFD